LGSKEIDVRKTGAARPRTTDELAKRSANYVGFDYSTLSSAVADFLRGQTHRICRQSGTSIVNIGKDLIAAKHHLSHGAFLKWVEFEVGLPARTAQAYMQMAQWATRKNASVAHLPPSLLYLLSARSTPSSYADDVLKRIEGGERIALQDVRADLSARKRFKTSSGKYREVRVLDANTATFGDELLSVFEENVTKAREENQRLFGSPDRVPEDS
jgi:hypothetical protein